MIVFAGERSDTLIFREPFDTQYPRIKLNDKIFTFRPESLLIDTQAIVFVNRAIAFVNRAINFDGL